MSILAYHMVDPHFDWGITRVTPNQFARQIEAAVRKHYNFCTVHHYLANGAPEKTICLTFDDGYRSVFDYAFPVLKKYHIPATLFINPAYVGQQNSWDVNIGWLKFCHLNWDQIRHLKNNGWEIGSHGFTHRDLTKLSTGEAKQELELSRLLIERRIASPVYSISYPFGNTKQQVCELAKQAGYKAGFVMSRGSADPFSIPRIGVYLLDGKITFLQKAGGRAALFYRLLQRILDFCSDGTVLLKQGLRNQNKKS